MTPPTELLFDIETLINSAQPRRILLLGNIDPAFLDNYCQQKALLNQACEITHIRAEDIQDIWALNQRFDVGLMLNLFEPMGATSNNQQTDRHTTAKKQLANKQLGNQVLARMRDVLTSQYCVALPLSHQHKESAWQLTDLFSFALSKVASYDASEPKLTLFKYNIEDYKKTPDWLNAENWANPQLWGKYWW